MKNMSPEEQYHFTRQPKLADDESDVIDLSHVIKVMWGHRLILISAILLGLVCAAVSYAALPSKWRASATLQIGQMPVSAAARDATLIEPSAQLVEKFKTLDSKILARVGFQPEQHSEKPAMLIVDTLKAVAVKNTNLIQVSVAGYSAESARKNIEAATQVLIGEHAVLFAATMQRLTAQLQDNADQIAAAKASQQRAQAMLKGMESRQSTPQFGPAIVAMQLVENKNAEVRRLEAERLVLEDLAAPTKTFLTKVVNSAQVDPSPYFPNLKLFIAIGLFFGILVGVGVSFYLEWRQNAAAQAV